MGKAAIKPKPKVKEYFLNFIYEKSIAANKVMKCVLIPILTGVCLCTLQQPG